MRRYTRELSVALTYLALLLLLAVAAPTFYQGDKLLTILVGSGPVLVAVVGMTLVILSRHIAISVGAQIALCGVSAGLLAKSGREAAWLVGIRPRRVAFGVFVLMGALSGLAAVLDAVRFADVEASARTGLEMQVIAAVVVGGVAISGGRGKLVGPLIGVAL